MHRRPRSASPDSPVLVRRPTWTQAMPSHTRRRHRMKWAARVKSTSLPALLHAGSPNPHGRLAPMGASAQNVNGEVIPPLSHPWELRREEFECGIATEREMHVVI